MSYIHVTRIKCDRCARYQDYYTDDEHEAWQQACTHGWSLYVGNLQLCPICMRVWRNNQHFTCLYFPVQIDKV